MMSIKALLGAVGSTAGAAFGGGVGAGIGGQLGALIGGLAEPEKPEREPEMPSPRQVGSPQMSAPQASGGGALPVGMPPPAQKVVEPYVFQGQNETVPQVTPGAQDPFLEMFK